MISIKTESARYTILEKNMNLSFYGSDDLKKEILTKFTETHIDGKMEQGNCSWCALGTLSRVFPYSVDDALRAFYRWDILRMTLSEQSGLPISFLHLMENIYEGSQTEESEKVVIDFLTAIPVGVNLKEGSPELIRFQEFANKQFKRLFGKYHKDNNFSFEKNSLENDSTERKVENLAKKFIDFFHTMQPEPIIKEFK